MHPAGLNVVLKGRRIFFFFFFKLECILCIKVKKKTPSVCIAPLFILTCANSLSQDSRAGQSPWP